MKLHKKLSDKVEFIGVNVGINEKAEGVKKYINANGLRFQNIFDKDKKIIKAFGVMGTPTNIIIDRKGIIKYIDASPPHNLEKHLSELLK
ncbi:MAG: TlpA family protein disulfide reductase [Nitrospirae bacterium]|nr:TlpA family protein disulfide reductase [Nitrospirota bacterium]